MAQLLSLEEKIPMDISISMSQEEHKILLDRLESEKQLAFKDSPPDAPLLTSIVSQLMAIDNKYKPYFKAFATQLKQDLFVNSISIKGLQLEPFNEDTPPIVETHEKEESRITEVQVEFTELFKKLTENRPDHFEILKGYFIIKLENNPLESYKLMVLFDSTFFIQPIRKKIAAIIPDAIFKKIDDFEKEVETGFNQEGNILCLILLHPRTNDGESIDKLKNTLGTIIDSYKYFESFSLKNQNSYIGNYYESSISKEDFFEEISYINGTLLSNGGINNEEEKIIKKLCSSFRTPLIIYRTLSGGNSGSKVIEVRPKKELGPEHEKRYIIKYSSKTTERKIYKEFEYFGKYIEGYKGFNEYECKYDKTLIYEGLRYSYAISDTEANSYSYNQILEKKDNEFHPDKLEIIDELFSIQLFQTWRDSIDKFDSSCKVLYEPYIDIPKIIEQIAKILNKSDEQVKSDELLFNFNKIWEKQFTFHQKICHGDLHTENFFKDRNGIYLIDFGYTGLRHALIDHSSLECSIKFKHCPFYLEIEELREIESELLLDSSFQLSTRFSKTSRPDLLEYLEIVKRLRNNSITFFSDSNSTTEYLLSLFIMTFRQIRYKDMNQLYAYHSALILSRRLIQLLNLDTI